MKTLITGADGFIGSHLAELLLAKGYNVRALSLYNSFNDWGWLEQIPEHDNLEVICGDVRDPYFCKEITKGIHTIFHLAALIAIPYSYIAPDSYLDNNVKGTLNICQAAKENGCSRVVHTSTSEVYGTAQYVPIVEFVTEQQRIRPENSEVFRLWSDNSKITHLAGFEPKYSLRQGLQKTIDWFTDKNNLSRYKIDIYNV